MIVLIWSLEVILGKVIYCLLTQGMSWPAGQFFFFVFLFAYFAKKFTSVPRARNECVFHLDDLHQDQ